MKDLNTKQLRVAIAEYTKRNTALALLLFAGDMFFYSAAIAGVIFLENIILKISCSIMAGLIISSIFVIAHDAAHDALTGYKTLNRLIARIALLPPLHTFGLWVTEHNRIHHQLTNIQKIDSWSPYSKEEFDALPAWRRVIERFYRTPPGVCFYYLSERWWKLKFYPFKSIAGKYNSVYWDFLLVVTYLVSFIGLLTYAGYQLDHTGPVELIFLGFVVPFLIWNFMMGFTVYQQHTHETIPWAKTREDRDQIGGQAEFTMHVQYPNWYNAISHNVMEHTAHHVDPRIPCYNLARAQKALSKLLDKNLHTVDFSVSGLFETMRKCKLYDFENHCWLDYDGNRTTDPVPVVTPEKYLQAA